MERFGSWFTHMLLSLTVLCSVLDNVPIIEREGKEKYAIATASISLILSFIVVTGHMVTSLRLYLVGTIFELFCAIIPLSMWIVGTAFIQNPYNSFSSNVDLDEGTGDGNEQIEYANLFFFSWIVLFSNTFLVGAIFRDYGSYDPQISGWLILMVSSVVLMGMAATLREDICKLNEHVVCMRTDFAIAIGGLVGFLSFIAILLVACSKMGAVSYLLISFVSSALFIFGVIFLTARDGPATSLGTMYFSCWTGAAVSTLLFVGGIQELFEAVAVEEEEAAKQRPPNQYGDDDI